MLIQHVMSRVAFFINATDDVRANEVICFVFRIIGIPNVNFLSTRTAMLIGSNHKE